MQQIIIGIDPQGKVRIQSGIKDQIAVIGLLELAKGLVLQQQISPDAQAAAKAEAEKPKILVAPPGARIG